MIYLIIIFFIIPLIVVLILNYTCSYYDSIDKCDQCNNTSKCKAFPFVVTEIPEIKYLGGANWGTGSSTKYSITYRYLEQDTIFICESCRKKNLYSGLGLYFSCGILPLFFIFLALRFPEITRLSTLAWYIGIGYVFIGPPMIWLFFKRVFSFSSINQIRAEEELKRIVTKKYGIKAGKVITPTEDRTKIDKVRMDTGERIRDTGERTMEAGDILIFTKKSYQSLTKK
ncbi:MAG: hypothetical protein WA081_22770 [Desulfosalsimonadaceae bacterium]